MKNSIRIRENRPHEHSAPRVLFLDHAGVLGGAELFLLDLAERWATQRLVLLFADGSFRERLQRKAIPVEVIAAQRLVKSIGRQASGIRQLLAAPGVLRLAWQVAHRAENFDLIFANSQKSLFIGALAAWIAGKPLVWYLHDILSEEHFSIWNRKLSVLVGNRFASRIITNSRASRDAFVAAGGHRELISVIYNGIDEALFSDTTVTDAAELRRQLGGNGRQIVGVFSRLAPWKGQHVMLKALQWLPNIEAWFVGAPLFADEQRYQMELDMMARNLGLADRIRFLGFREDIPNLLRAVDIVAHTSIAPEPFGRVIVEGMLAGKSVVATRAGGVLEILEDGVTGSLVPPNDPRALAEVLRGLMAQPGRANRLGKAAQTVARERFSVVTMIAEMEREVAMLVH